MSVLWKDHFLVPAVLLMIYQFLPLRSSKILKSNKKTKDQKDTAYDCFCLLKCTERETGLECIEVDSVDVCVGLTLYTENSVLGHKMKDYFVLMRE